MTTPRLPTLTGMRFVAALLVFAFHSSLENLFRDPGANRLYVQVFDKAGWMGVSFFFVLSGFVLTWSARPDDTPRRFWRRRAAKIYPNHAVMWVVALALVLGTGAAVTAPTAVGNLLLVHAWVPRIQTFASLNDVSWSLAGEAFFYLCFPLLLAGLLRIRPSRLWYWAGGTVAAIALTPVVAGLLLPDTPHLPWESTSVWHFWFVYVLPPVRMLEFLLGMLMARIVLTGQWIRLGLAPAVGVLAVAYAVALYLPFYLHSLIAVTVGPLALLVAAAATADARTLASPLRGRLWIWLGEVSFAFYLVHRLLLLYGHQAIGTGSTWSTPAAIGLILAAFAVSLALAWLLHVAVEQPVMRHWSRPRRRPPTDGSTVDLPHPRPAPVATAEGQPA
ncbi:acyltransferase family protein [Phytohabitans kaempferiae]|uniref:Acyltransferase family protein n=1 Tax=Phytohabitans kaempferiae TaxID=1620943 RepID=A0ABV6MAT1_9ACTN